jgi:hypothetical protein
MPRLSWLEATPTIAGPSYAKDESTRANQLFTNSAIFNLAIRTVKYMTLCAMPLFAS